MEEFPCCIAAGPVSPGWRERGDLRGEGKGSEVKKEDEMERGGVKDGAWNDEEKVSQENKRKTK